MRYFIFLLLGCLTTNLIAQTTTIDSLQEVIIKHTKAKQENKRIEAIKALCTAYDSQEEFDEIIKLTSKELKDISKVVEGSSKVHLLVTEAKAYMGKFNYERNFEYLSKATELFERYFSLDNDEDQEKAVALDRYGVCLLDLQREDDAIVSLKKALAIFQKLNEPNTNWIRTLRDLSISYESKGDINTALEYVRTAKEMAKETGDKRMEAIMNHTMGVNFLNLGESEKALVSFKASLRIAREIDYKFLIGQGLLCRGATKIDLEKKADWEEGKKDLDEAKKIFIEIGNEYGVETMNEQFALYFYKKRDEEMTLKHIQDYINFSEQIGEKDILADGNIEKGRYLMEFNQLDSARQSFLKGIELAESSGIILLMKMGYDYLAELEEKEGDYKSAFTYYRKYSNLKDSLYNQNLNQAIGRENATQNVEGAERAQKEAELQAEVLAGRNRLYLAIAIGLLSILLIGGYLFRQLQKTRKQLETQNTQLTNLNATKDRFFGIIAHDIRGPITSLDGVGEQLTYYLKKNNTERVNKLTAQIDNTSKKLTNLLDNLLNWALLQKGTIPYYPKSLDIHEVVQENMELYSEVAAMKNIQFQNKVEKGTLAYADISAVNTIVRNLINNAVKFTKEGDAISVSTAVENDKVLIEVNDTGTGIAAERLEKIFELNTERKKGTAGEKGSGLGLLLCKDLVELNKGTIRVISELGKGSKFIFSLPTQ